MTVAIRGFEQVVEVGHDGDAVVLRAWQPAFNRDVAVLVFPGRRLEQVEADARRAAPLAGHPNVVTVHDLGVTETGAPYLVTELLEQGSLADAGPSLDWYGAVAVTVKVAGVVQAAAQIGLTGLVVTPAEVFLSRFGEPKVAAFRHRPSPAVTDVDGLRALLRSLLPAGEDPLAGAATDDLPGLIRALQEAQRAAGRAVTELPAGTAAAVAASAPLPEDFSELVTVGPPPTPPRRPVGVWAAGALVVAGLGVGTAVVGDRTTAPRATVPTSPTTAVVAAPASTIYDSAGFTGPEWRRLDGTAFRADAVDGQYRVSATGRWGNYFWKQAGHRRLGVEVTARLTPTPGVRFTIHCGVPAPGSAFLAATIGTDASWEIKGHDRVLATGAAPERQGELREAFVLRLDCVTDTSPSRAVFFLNDVMLGAGDGTGSFQLVGGVLESTATGTEPYELSLEAVTVRRLD